MDFEEMKLSKAFVAMLLVSMMLAAQSILLKYVYQSGVGWGSSVLWMNLFQFFIALVFCLPPKNFQDLFVSITKIKSVGKLFFLSEILSWGGTLSGYYALSFIPVSISKAIGSTQPVFVLMYALLFIKIAPKMFKEYLGKDGVVKKIALFIFTIIGVILMK
jgi:drug/metabolite transporter (DMT)-like permease